MKRLVFFSLMVSLAFTPAVSAQSKQELALQQIQRDVAQLEEQVRALQKSQDDRINSIQGLLQQAVDASTRMAAAMKAMQTEVDTKLNEQQNKLAAPVATVGTKVDQMQDDVRNLGATVTDLVHRMDALDRKLTDISSAIRTMQAPPPTAPPVAGTAAAPVNECTGLTSEGLWEDARRDQTGGKLDLAMSAYQTYVKCFRDSANAPEAQYNIAKMYYDAKQYDDAVKAFADVIDGFPENRSTQDAVYYKAVALSNIPDHKTEAVAALRKYIDGYPHGVHVAEAHAKLQALGMEHRANKKRSQ